MAEIDDVDAAAGGEEGEGLADRGREVFAMEYDGPEQVRLIQVEKAVRVDILSR